MILVATYYGRYSIKGAFFMKSNFVEITKVYNFVDEISKQNIFMSNITYYKNVTPKTSTYVVDKFEQYFDLEKQSRQTYTNRKNIEGYKLKILVSDILLLPENRIKLRKYIEQCIVLITAYEKVDRLKYVVSRYKSIGGANYLIVHFIDRVIYDKPQLVITTKKVWVNKNTGKRVSKTYKNAVREKQVTEETKYFSSKIRFKLIHQNDSRQFTAMMNTIKELLKQYEINVFKNEHTYWFEKKHIKKRICKNGNYYFVNDYDNRYKGVFKEFESRAIKAFNTLVNSLNMAKIDESRINVDNFRYDVEQTAIKYKSSIDRYEESILNYIDLVVSGDIYDVYGI